jgi:hypothetical protein
MLKHLYTWLCVLLLLLFPLGCGGDRPKTIPVEGKITFGGGPCPAAGYIDFQPIEPAEGYPTRPGSAEFAEDGLYAVTSYEPGDGLVPGRYRVHIECWKELPDEASMSPGVSHVPADYVPDELVVEPTARGRLVQNYDIPVR